MRKILVVLLLVLSVLSSVNISWGAGAKMPAIPGERQYEESGVCSNGAAIVFVGYERPENEDAIWWDAEVMYLRGDPRPVSILIPDNPFNRDSSASLYVDYDGDGLVDDYWRITRDNDPSPSYCELLARAKQRRR